MSSLSAAFDAPIVFNEDGLEFSFPKLDIDDHAKWCEELHAVRKPATLKLIPGNAQPIERFKMTRNAEFETPTLDTIADLLYTPAGSRTAVMKSLAKAGKSEDEAKAIIKKIKPSKFQRLAMDVSGLFETLPPPLPKPNPGGVNPLAQGGSPSNPTSTPEIGAGQDSSSASTFANPLGD